MQVGALEETITVSGAAPLVDTQNVRQQKVVSSDLLAALPSSMKGLSATLITLVPGLSGTSDVGGSSGIYRSNSQSGGAFFHGKADIITQYDGLDVQSAAPGAVFYALNPNTAQETTVQTGGGSAQTAGTIEMNMVPKEGSNKFTFDFSGTGTGQHLQSDNLNDSLRARGVTTTNRVLVFYDTNATVGGPIKQDKLWFFGAVRASRNKNTVAGLYFNKTIAGPLYTPDLDRPAYREEWLTSTAERITWQVSQRNKVNQFAELQWFYNRGRGEFFSPEAYMSLYNLAPQGMIQESWSNPLTSKLLLEAGASWVFVTNKYPYPGSGDFATVPGAIATTDLLRAFQYNARANYANKGAYDRAAERLTASYVTGSHAFKGGIQLEHPYFDIDQTQPPVAYQFRGTVPAFVVQWATPYIQKSRATELGIFAQDQWTRKRLTLNYGLRFDYFNGWTPEQHLPGTRFVPARDLAAVHSIPSFTDLNPRLGASYDLFGSGRTALKVSLGRYVEALGTSLTNNINPVATSVLSVTRTWSDNGNYVPDCDLTNFAANGECGPISDQNFGKNNPLATRYADDVTHGFGKRNYSWDFGAEVQQQLRTGVSLTAGYYRNWSGNFRVADNQLVTHADFSPYCITAPVDPRLPNGGGYQICGLYDVNPSRFGRVTNVVTQSTHYYNSSANVTCGDIGSVVNRTGGRPSGRNCGTSNFFGVSINTRFGKGIQLNGGVDTGRTVIDNCFVVKSPQQLLDCHTVIPIGAQTQYKALASVPLAADVTVSATFQSVAGRPLEANYAVPNSAIAPSLGRNLAACGAAAVCTATATVPLVPPYTMFLDRRNQVDLRFSKGLKVGSKARLRANIDVYNVFNGSAVLGANNTYGPLWQTPAAQLNLEVDSILPGRLVHFGGELSF